MHAVAEMLYEISYIFLKAKTNNGEMPNVVRAKC